MPKSEWEKIYIPPICTVPTCGKISIWIWGWGEYEFMGKINTPDLTWLTLWWRRSDPLRTISLLG